jgi:hypothetical protein
VPFLRYTRDRRGYETTYLMHGYRSAQGPGRTRVLYLFRSPAHVRVGRRALDEEAREALEHTHPDLSFDWSALGREPAPHHFEERDRSARYDRSRVPPARIPPPAPAPLIDDQTLLGRILGAADAGRLRTQYGELVRRIARRAVSPDDRDRLTERAQRLNPDDWPDEAAVRAGVQTIEAAWNEIRAELPSRRWGRRGRDRRPPPTDLVAPSGTAAGDDASAIIERTGDADATEDHREVAGRDHGASAPGDDDPVRAESDAGAAGDGLPRGE